MNQEKINELKSLMRKATPGPWRTSSRTPARNCPKSIVVADESVIAEVKSTRTFAHKYGSRNDIRAWDAEYIAAVNPLAILELLASYERLEKEANWLACKLEEKEHGCKYCEEYNKECIPSLQACGYKGPDNWRAAARKAVEK